MASPIEARDEQPRLEQIPMDAVQQILTEVEEMPPEDEEAKKDRLRLESLRGTLDEGGYRYNLVYGEDDNGVGYFELRLAPSEHMGATRQSYEEVAISRAAAREGVLARTGYIQINSDEVREVRPDSDHFGSSMVVEDTLGLYFPDRRISVQHSVE